jgi:hypothetical protein
MGIGKQDQKKQSGEVEVHENICCRGLRSWTEVPCLNVAPLSFFGSSTESVGAFWFRERPQAVIERSFRGAEGPKSVCLSQS